LWRPTLRDPDDDMVLELAVAAGCAAVVTYDRLPNTALPPSAAI